jgi:hypothetical protein
MQKYNPTIHSRSADIYAKKTSVAHAVVAFHLTLDCTPVDVPDYGQRKEAHQDLRDQTAAPGEDASPTMDR